MVVVGDREGRYLLADGAPLLVAHLRQAQSSVARVDVLVERHRGGAELNFKCDFQVKEVFRHIHIISKLN